VVGGRISQVQRNHTFSNFLINDPAFASHRAEAVGSDGTMLQTTVEGLRYYNKQKDGSRKAEERARSTSRGIGAFVLFDPTLPMPVLPVAGILYNDYNAFDKGIQATALIAGVFNQGQVSIPNVGAGFDFSAKSSVLLIPSTERPVRNGHLVNGEGVGHTLGNLEVGLGHDLGGGLRFRAEADFRYDRYSKPFRKDNWTEGFVLPPSGWNREFTGELTWLHKGFQLNGSYGKGYRPDGLYGLPSTPPAPPVALTPMISRYTRWTGRAGYDHEVAQGTWLHLEAGYSGGEGFDRFQSLNLGGLGGDVRVAGIRNNAITADKLTYAKAGMVLPTGPRLRLTLSLDEAWVRSLDNQKTYEVTGLGIAGDLPGFWYFTTVRVDLGVGLISTLPGVRSCNGFVALLRVF